MAPLTMSVPVVGAFAENRQISPEAIIGLCLIGLFAHAFGFSLNDLIDAKVDRANPSRQLSPLVTGQIPIETAVVFTVFQVPAAFFVYLFVFDSSVISLQLIGMSMALSVLYNLFSKRGRFPRLLAEISLAASIGCLCLLGSSTQSSPLSLGARLITLALTLILLLLNSVPNHLKDLLADHGSGHSNFALSVGVTINEDGEIFIPRTLWIYFAAIQLAIIACVIALLSIFETPPLQSLLSILFMVLSGLHLRNLLLRESFIEIRKSYPLLNGYYNYLALSLILMPWAPSFWILCYWLVVAGFALLPVLFAWQVFRNPYRLVQ
ncbi:MAG: hypothetical protein CNIPEHKO_02829 [Anaerolineales bacterium]|nr:hypothetical protein [Anaerolineales bacterium]